MLGWLRGWRQRQESLSRVAKHSRETLTTQTEANRSVAEDARAAAHDRQRTAAVGLSAAVGLQITLNDLLRLVTR